MQINNRGVFGLSRLPNRMPIEYFDSGVLTATTITLGVGGKIIAGNTSGSRLEEDSAGLRFYASNGTTVLFNAKVSDGSLTLSDATIDGEFDTSARGTQPGLWIHNSDTTLADGTAVKAAHWTVFTPTLANPTVGEQAFRFYYNQVPYTIHGTPEIDSNIFLQGPPVPAGGTRPQMLFRMDGAISLTGNAMSLHWNPTENLTLVGGSSGGYVQAANTSPGLGGYATANLHLQPDGNDLHLFTDATGNQQLFIRSDLDASTIVDTGALVIGKSGSVQIGIDGNEIQARSAGGGSNTLNINVGGGNVSLGDSTSVISIPGNLKVGSSGSAISQLKMVAVTLPVPAMAAGTTATVTVTVSGTTTGDRAIYLQGMSSTGGVINNIDCKADAIDFYLVNAKSTSISAQNRTIVLFIVTMT